jgi:hypothetical protein
MASSSSQRERFTILLAFRKGLSMKPVNNKLAAAASPPAVPGAPGAPGAPADTPNHAGPDAVLYRVHT